MRAPTTAIDFHAEAIAAARARIDLDIHHGPGPSSTQQPGLLEGAAQCTTAAGMSAAGEIRLFWTRRYVVSKVSLLACVVDSCSDSCVKIQLGSS